MARKEGAIKKIIKYLQDHVGEPIPTQTLNEIAYPTGSWDRSLRHERQTKGLDYTYDPQTMCYTLHSLDRKEVTPTDERYISAKLSAMVKIRDNSTCRMCGRKDCKKIPNKAPISIVSNVACIVLNTLVSMDVP